MVLLVIPRSRLRRRFEVHTGVSILSLVNHTVVSSLRLVLKLVHGSNGHHIPAHDVLADVPRQFLSVVLGVLAVADVEDSVELFERESLGLGQEEVAVNPAEQIPASVPTKGAGGGEGCS